MSIIRNIRKGDNISGANMNEISSQNKVRAVRAGVKDPASSELGDDIDGE